MFPLSPYDNLVCWFGLLSRGARSFGWMCVSSLSAKTIVSQAILKSQFSAGSMVKPPFRKLCPLLSAHLSVNLKGHLADVVPLVSLHKLPASRDN